MVSVKRKSIDTTSGGMDDFLSPDDSLYFLKRWISDLLMPDELSLYPYRTNSRAKAAAETTAPLVTTTEVPSEPAGPVDPAEPAETIEPSTETHVEAPREEPTEPSMPSMERPPETTVPSPLSQRKHRKLRQKPQPLHLQVPDQNPPPVQRKLHLNLLPPGDLESGLK